MPLPKVSIDVTRSTADCEDCGGYEYAHGTLSFEDGIALDVSHDGHLGGGTWDNRDEDLYLWCLAKLGYTVLHNGKSVPVPPFYVNTYERGFREQFELPLPAGTLPLHITTADFQPKDPSDYPEIHKATIHVTNENGETEEVVFERTLEDDGQSFTANSWDGEWAPVLLRLLQSVSDLTLNLRVEEDEVMDVDSSYDDDPY